MQLLSCNSPLSGYESAAISVRRRLAVRIENGGNLFQENVTQLSLAGHLLVRGRTRKRPPWNDVPTKAACLRLLFAVSFVNVASLGTSPCFSLLPCLGRVDKLGAP